MTETENIQLIGVVGSPYTRKMLSLLRYRRISYKMTWGQPELVLPTLGLEMPRPVLLPVFVLPDTNGDLKAVTDSTPIIRRLEDMSLARSVLPVDPALAFIDYLLEDFGDEWVTKYMFHYRWHAQADADNAGTLLPLHFRVNLPSEEQEQLKKILPERQIGRLYVVGSNETTAPIIDASYQRYLRAMEAHLQTQPFMLGNRPGAGDFAMFGQLTQLVGFDPTPRTIAHKLSPRTVAWTSLMEELSGLEPSDGDWNNPDDMPETLGGILNEAGRVYVPALLANSRAVHAGEKTWEAEIDGARWTQPTFSYQAKCLMWINEQYQALSVKDRARVDRILAGTGCEALLTGDV
ncbi:glutathione S-transferase N-terminal domain-containing protein [Porticoccaceae bacterium]|jgi:glutathione S-transferase|nr:glutathione S-transferase N-terminal domain-containing protein [Porticoccaceae bacterium]|tara:strand:- start:5769 stop:6815 length:1047 start_codon:yes stop_codon:yes gene_type:complete